MGFRFRVSGLGFGFGAGVHSFQEEGWGPRELRRQTLVGLCLAFEVLRVEGLGLRVGGGGLQGRQPSELDGV